MILRFSLVATIIGFIDCMLGFSAFIYLNIEEYRHRMLGSPSEVLWSYILAGLGFIKGLVLCIPAAQVMVNRKRAVTGRWACVLWFILSFLQMAMIGELAYFFFWPTKERVVKDVFLTVLRILHAIFLLISLVFVFLFWNEMGQLLPPKPPTVRKPKKAPKTRKGKNAAAHAQSDPNGGTTGNGDDGNNDSD